MGFLANRPNLQKLKSEINDLLIGSRPVIIFKKIKDRKIEVQEGNLKYQFIWDNIASVFGEYIVEYFQLRNPIPTKYISIPIIEFLNQYGGDIKGDQPTIEKNSIGRNIGKLAGLTPIHVGAGLFYIFIPLLNLTDLLITSQHQQQSQSQPQQESGSGEEKLNIKKVFDESISEFKRRVEVVKGIKKNPELGIKILKDTDQLPEVFKYIKVILGNDGLEVPVFDAP